MFLAKHQCRYGAVFTGLSEKNPKSQASLSTIANLQTIVGHVYQNCMNISCCAAMAGLPSWCFLFSIHAYLLFCLYTLM